VVGYATAVILLALRLIPKLGALVAVMPPAVLGGATVVFFGVVAMAGVRIVAHGGFSGRTMRRLPRSSAVNTALVTTLTIR